MKKEKGTLGNLVDSIKDPNTIFEIYFDDGVVWNFPKSELQEEIKNTLLYDVKIKGMTKSRKFIRIWV